MLTLLLACTAPLPGIHPFTPGCSGTWQPTDPANLAPPPIEVVFTPDDTWSSRPPVLVEPAVIEDLALTQWATWEDTSADPACGTPIVRGIGTATVGIEGFSGSGSVTLAVADDGRYAHSVANLELTGVTGDLADRLTTRVDSTGAEEGATPVLGWSDLGGDATYELAGRTERSNITIDAGTVTATYD
ncbi:MAG: hypothetical protein H6734_10150 [Alphaproteobacteria bacterium]|nr:hypothetical protein [Alphaproteobacteria bacterium]